MTIEVGSLYQGCPFEETALVDGHRLFCRIGSFVAMAGAATLKVRMLAGNRTMTAKAGTQGITGMERHETALFVRTLALNGMASLRTTGGRRRLAELRSIVADAAAWFMMASVALHILMGGVIEDDGQPWRRFGFEDDGTLGSIHPCLVVCLGRGAPDE